MSGCKGALLETCGVSDAEAGNQEACLVSISLDEAVDLAPARNVRPMHLLRPDMACPLKNCMPFGNLTGMHAASARRLKSSTSITTTQRDGLAGSFVLLATLPSAYLLKNQSALQLRCLTWRKIVAETTIEWTRNQNGEKGFTFNPWIGCTKVGPGCDNCYAEAYFDKRRHVVVQWGPNQPRKRTAPSTWAAPLRWNREAAAAGVRHRVFCASLADVFDNEVPVQWRVDLFDLVRRCENLDFLLLTKRVGNVTRMLQEVASILRIEHGTQAERELGLQAGHVGRAGDRRGGSNLARREADVRSLDRRNEGDTVRASSGGTEDAGRLPAGAGDDRRQAALRGSGTAGVASLQWTDPARAHGEPQGWGEGPQPPGQPGTGDVQRAEAARGAGAGRRASRREGVESPEGTGVGGGCGVDEVPTGERLASEGHRGTLRHHAEVGLAHLHREDLAARLDLLAWVERWLAGDAPSNVWLGASITSQPEADRDIRKLLDVPSAKRFLSMEPLLGPVNLTDVPMPGSGHGHHEFSPIITGNALSRPLAYPRLPAVDWVIVGGESGPNARPMHPDWARSLRNQCQAASVPFLFKQWGEWVDADNGPEDDAAYDGKSDCWAHIDGGHHGGEMGVDFFNSYPMYRVGKRAAGRLLDGREWNEVPV